MQSLLSSRHFCAPKAVGDPVQPETLRVIHCKILYYFWQCDERKLRGRISLDCLLYHARRSIDVYARIGLPLYHEQWPADPFSTIGNQFEEILQVRVFFPIVFDCLKPCHEFHKDGEISTVLLVGFVSLPAHICETVFGLEIRMQMLHFRHRKRGQKGNNWIASLWELNDVCDWRYSNGTKVTFHRVLGLPLS